MRRAVFLEGLDDGLDFVVGDEGSLRTYEAGGAWGREEHVAAANEGIGTLGVEDGAGVDLRGDLEGDARGKVGLDDAGDDVHRRALGGDDEVDAGGAGELGEARDGGFDFRGRDHHEVGEFVDDRDDVGQALGDYHGSSSAGMTPASGAWLSVEMVLVSPPVFFCGC